MDDRSGSVYSEDELERLLSEGLTAPPNEVLTEVTPWRRAMNRILIGLALGTVTLNFWGLNYLLPAAGHLLLLLGLRVLRRENGSFRVWWHILLVQTGLYVLWLLRQAAPGWQGFYQTAPGQALTGATLVLELVQYLCLWLGLRAVRRSAGLSPGAGSALALLVFNALLVGSIAVGLTQLGWPVFLGILVIYICIIRGLFKLSRELDEAGYAVRPAPVRVPDLPLALGLTGAVLAGIAAVSLTCNRLPMDWQAVEPDEHSAVEALKTELARLGFPEYVLDDLSAQDIQACAGPVRVVSDTDTYSMRYGAAEDTPEPLTITGVAVELAGERERWRIFHHFSWAEGTTFYGTEAIQFWPAYNHNEGWSKSSPATGRLLYDQNGTALWAPYHFLGEETYTTDSLFFGVQTSNDLLASFSFPARGENCRGYVTYETAEVQDGWIIDSWCNYAHARRMFQYPALTALDWIKTVAVNAEDEPFAFDWSALQFFPYKLDFEGGYSVIG